MKNAKLIAAAIVAMLLVATLAQNSDPVPFKFWPLVDFKVAKTVLIIISAAFGSLATLGAQWYWRHQQRKSNALNLSPGSKQDGM